MQRIARSFIAALAFILALPATGEDAPRCEQRLHGSLTVDIDEDGTVLVPVKVNGQEAWMALVMSQGVPTLFHAAVATMGLKPRGYEGGAQISVRGRPITQFTTIRNLVLDRANFTGWDFYVFPDFGEPLRQYQGKPMIGLLTSVFMQAVDLELNLGERKMNLFSQTRCGGNALYWGGEFTAVRLFNDGTGLMIFPMELEGQRIETSFNTGSRHSVISSAVTKKYFGFDEESEGIDREVHERGEAAVYRAMGLTAKGLSISNARIRLLPGKKCATTKSGSSSRAIAYSSCLSATPFSIGTDLLKKLRVYIASKEQMVYFTRASAPAAAGSVPPATVESTTQ